MATADFATAETEYEDSLLHTSAHALSDAAHDARAQAKIAAQNVKDGVGWGVYKAAFGVSFGVVFTGVFLTELLPGQSSLRRGLEDGAIDALEAIDERKRLRQQPKNEPVDGSADETLPPSGRRAKSGTPTSKTAGTRAPRPRRK